MHNGTHHKIRHAVSAIKAQLKELSHRKKEFAKKSISGWKKIDTLMTNNLSFWDHVGIVKQIKQRYSCWVPIQTHSISCLEPRQFKNNRLYFTHCVGEGKGGNFKMSLLSIIGRLFLNCLGSKESLPKESLVDFLFIQDKTFCPI